MAEQREPAPPEHEGGASLSRIEEKLEAMARDMHTAGLAEYVEMVRNPKRLFWQSFVNGIARGLGMAIGFTILAALVIYILQLFVTWNLPLIGDFIANLADIVINQLNTK